MSSPKVSLGYVILCVKDVSRQAWTSMKNRLDFRADFFHDDGGKAYAELETGAACLAFASLEMAKLNLSQDVIPASLDKLHLRLKLH